MVKVWIKQLQVEMEVKTKGIELHIAEPDGKHRGDLVVKKSGLIWCKGKTQPQNGNQISWNKFIEFMGK